MPDAGDEAAGLLLQGVWVEDISRSKVLDF